MIGFCESVVVLSWFGYVWLCWLCCLGLVVFGCVWLCLVVFGCVWLCLVTSNPTFFSL